ncbi:hypothetical protein NM688_g687 [Phlebia brevispora]|uniref:Uncharacterized protein n=1 Tax=Phlebia brevispora TaxID=194682 RepID=A0ACC1TDH4_9APHY|nr:hypothetical protein NM688_g687 [Phlebia brevispora]
MESPSASVGVQPVPSNMVVPLTEFIAPTVGIVIPLSLMLAGVLSVQVFYYLTEYEEDSPLMKGFVIFVWFVENAQSAFCIHVIHTYISDGFGDILGIAQITWSVGLYVIMEVLLIALIQSFYVYRAWHVSKKRWLVAVIPVGGSNVFLSSLIDVLSRAKGITLALRAGFGFGTAILSYKHPTWESFREAQAVKYTVNTALALGIVVDLMVALFLVYELHSEARSSPRTSVPYLQTIMIYIIGTGASTLIMSIIILVTYNVIPGNLLFAGCIAIICKLYSNTMLANLNARKRLRSTISPVQVFDSGAASSRSGTTDVAGREAQHPHPVPILTQGENIVTYGDTKHVIA